MKINKNAIYIILILTLLLSSFSKIDLNIYEEQYTQERPDEKELISRGWVSYKDFGAKGDGKVDDMLPISKTHEFANKHNLKVRADGGLKYYIGKGNTVINIQTDTDFGNASFIIDDRNVENRTTNVFSVAFIELKYSLNNSRFLLM